MAENTAVHQAVEVFELVTTPDRISQCSCQLFNKGPCIQQFSESGKDGIQLAVQELS